MNEGYSELDLCPFCFNVSLVARTDENERQYNVCRTVGCGLNEPAVPEAAEDDRFYPGEENTPEYHCN